MFRFKKAYAANCLHHFLNDTRTLTLFRSTDQLPKLVIFGQIIEWDLDPHNFLRIRIRDLP